MISRSERSELLSLIRKREKVMRAQAAQRSSELLAQFEAQSARIYHWDDDEVWSAVKADAEAAVAAAQKAIEKQCVKRGIPSEFAPGLELHWYGRGSTTLWPLAAREIRRAAKARIEAMEAEAIAHIERMSLDAQTQLLSAGLEGDAARQFLHAMPSMEALMPALELPEVERLISDKRAPRRIGSLH